MEEKNVYTPKTKWVEGKSMEYFKNHIDEAVALNRSNSNFGFEIYRGGPDAEERDRNIDAFGHFIVNSLSPKKA
jgi:hypothetical protein